MTEAKTNAWIPKKAGETFTAEVREIVRAWSDVRTNGGKDMERGWYPLLHCADENGVAIDWHAFEDVAERRVLEKQPLPGETITVTFLGVSQKPQPKGRNAPKLYELVVHDRDPVVEAKTIYGQLGATPRQTPDADTTPATADREEFGY